MKQKQIKEAVNFLIRMSLDEKGTADVRKSKEILKIINTLPYPEKILILKEYKNRLQSIEEKTTLYIKTAIKLPKTQLERIKRVFEKKYTIANIEQEENADLIAGFQIKIGSNVFDYSVREQIQQIKQSLVNN